MLFDSTAYILFLILATLAYWCLPFRKQNYMLLAASYFFYGWWDWRFLILMAVSTVVDYLVAHKIAASSDEHTSELQSLTNLVFRFLLVKKNKYFKMREKSN